MIMKHNKVILNWKDITSEVDIVIGVDTDEKNKSKTIVYYKNWWEYKLWESDDIDLISTILEPKYKIWDYVVEEWKWKSTYMKIHSIKFMESEFRYNIVYSTDRLHSYYSEENLRIPTKEECQTYFR